MNLKFMNKQPAKKAKKPVLKTATSATLSLSDLQKLYNSASQQMNSASVNQYQAYIANRPAQYIGSASPTMGTVSFGQTFPSIYGGGNPSTYGGNAGMPMTTYSTNMPVYVDENGNFTNEPPKEKKKMLKAKVTLDSVIMTDEKKSEIKSAISQIGNQDLIFDKWGFGEVFEKGVSVSLLFWGPPGTGKTLTAEAIATELEAELKIYSTADIESAEPGGAERAIKEIFEEAMNIFLRENKKRVILFDECDSLLMDRNEVGPILGAQINVLLGEIEKYPGVLIFTTNRLGKLDAALERRITKKIHFEFPSEEQRIAIWKRLIPSKAPIAADVLWEKLAITPLPGGNIKNAVLNAVRMAAYAKQKEINLENFLMAVEQEVKAMEDFLAQAEEAPHWAQHGISRQAGQGLKLVKEKVGG